MSATLVPGVLSSRSLLVQKQRSPCHTEADPTWNRCPSIKATGFPHTCECTGHNQAGPMTLPLWKESALTSLAVSAGRAPCL